MINEHDLNDWDNLPPKKPPQGDDTPSGYIPLTKEEKPLVGTSIGFQIDSDGVEATVQFNIPFGK